MEVRAGYKQTEVGVIPEDWSVSTVGAEFDIQLGKMLDAEKNVGIPKPYLGNKSVQWNRIDVSDLSMMAMSPTDLQRYRLMRGDLLVCEGGEVGRAAIWDDQLPDCYYQKALHRLRPKRGFDSGLMAELLRYWADHGLLANYVTQTSIAHLTREKFNDVPMSVPQPAEQRAIATALSDVDALLAAQDKLIAKKRDLKQAAMQQLLTGSIRLPGFHGEWEVKAIQELSQVGRGRVISYTEISKSSSPTYPVFSSQTSNSGIMGYLDAYDFEGDYVTWTTDGANAGTVFARSGRFNCTNVCGTIKLHDSDHRFIAAALGRVSQSHVSRHLGNPKLMNDVMKKIQITIPKTRAEQTAIAEVLTGMDAELAALEQRRDKTRALKQAMMQELLTGRTRLV